MKKLFAGLFATVFLLSCNLVPVSNTPEVPRNDILINPVDNQLGENLYNTKSVQPQIVNFENKVKYQNLSYTSVLPATEHFEIPFKTKGNTRGAVRVPENGSFRLVIKTGINFQITDDDTTDGTAIVELPQGMYEGFVTVLRDVNSKNANPSITLKDDLYYIKEELKELETTKGGWRNLTDDNWYQFGKRVLTFPQEISRINNYGDLYVLDFNNNGVKDLLFRWYKSDSYDYPLGTKVIGNAGGNIELPGVGKLELPQGALDQDTVVSLRQELQGYEFIDPSDGTKINDYVSPLLRIEPKGLTLNAPSKVFLETNSTRLGNNSPFVMEYFKTQDNKNWDGLNYYLFNINDLAQDSPAILDELSFVAKHIPNNIEPSNGFQTEIVELTKPSSFEIKVFDDRTEPSSPFIIEKIMNNLFIHYIPSATNNNELTLTKSRVKKTFEYFSDITGIYPASRRKIDLYLYNNLNDKAKTYSSGSMHVSGILLNGIEHEIWHIFQYAKKSFSPLYAATIAYTKKWAIFESSAEYMGALAAKNRTGNNQMMSHYREKLMYSLEKVNDSFPYFIPIISDPYLAIGYLAYINNPTMMINIVDEIRMNKFHDYATDTYLQEGYIDNPYPPQSNSSKTNFVIRNERLQTKNITISHTTNSPLRFHSGTTENHSAHYYKITHDKDGDSSISIKPANISCTISNIKLKVLYYKNDNDLPTAYDVQEDVALSINTWKNLSNFDKDKYSHFVIIVSNSDGQFHSIANPSCNANFDIAYTSKMLIPGGNQNIIKKIDGADMKMVSNFSYRNSANTVLNITSLSGLNAIASIGGTLGGSVISGQPGKDISRYCPEEDRAKSKRSGSLSLSLSFPTELDLSRKKSDGKIVGVTSKTITGTIISGNYQATDTPDRSTRTGDCSNWSSWGYNRCYVVDKFNGSATITYSGGNTATVSGTFTGNGKYSQGGYWGCSYSDTTKSGAPFSISENFSFTIPVTEKQL